MPTRPRPPPVPAARCCAGRPAAIRRRPGRDAGAALRRGVARRLAAAPAEAGGPYRPPGAVAPAPHAWARRARSAVSPPSCPRRRRRGGTECRAAPSPATNRMPAQPDPPTQPDPPARPGLPAGWHATPAGGRRPATCWPATCRPSRRRIRSPEPDRPVSRGWRRLRSPRRVPASRLTARGQSERSAPGARPGRPPPSGRMARWRASRPLLPARPGPLRAPRQRRQPR